MKNKLTKITGIAVLGLAMVLFTGCSTTDITKLVGALGQDSAVVTGTVTSVYGTVKIVRVGPTATNSVVVSPDGTVSINK